jgi:hypothetical protein
MVMVMQMGGGKGMMMKKPVILVLTSICVAALLLLLSVIYPEARSLSLSFSRIRESIISWQSGNLSDASSSSSVSAMNLDNDDDVGVRIRDANIECSSPLKVFMYDLPRKYNLGMVKKDDGINQELPWTDQEVAPALKTRWGVNRQHSVEYWMMLDMLQDDHDPSHNHDGKEEEKKAAVRVKDPEQADVFFVPFFSSLSFNTYGRIMLGPEAKIDKLLQVSMLLLLHSNSLSVCLCLSFENSEKPTLVSSSAISVSSQQLRKTHTTVKLSNIHVISKTKKNPHYCQAQQYQCHLGN